MARARALLMLWLALWTFPAGALTLTPEEQAWLDNHGELRLGIDASWPPFEFRDAQGNHQGLAADYIDQIRRRLDVKLTPVEPSSWTEVLQRARAGDLDLLPGIMSTPERQQYLNFTRPYLDFPIVILSQTRGPQPSSIDDLYGLRVGVVADYAPHELLRNQHPDLSLQAYPSVAAALQALATGQVDAFVGDLASSVWSLRQLKLDGISISGETPYRYQLAMATPKNHPMLASILDKVFAEITPEEAAAIQEHWVGGALYRKPDWGRILLYGLPALLLLAGVLAFVLRVNRRLSNEMASRAALQDELRSSEQHYRGLVESLNAIAWEMRVDDYCYTYVSPHAERLLGYPLSDWLEPGFWRRTLHPDDTAWANAFCEAETLAGRDHSLDYRMIAADGRVLWVRDIITLIPHGETQMMRGLMIDITEAKQTEQALRLSEQKFASVFHNCPDIIVIARRTDGSLLAINHTFEQQIGLKASEALGRTATELDIWGIPGIGPKLLQRLQQGNPLHNLEMPFRRANGETFIGLISAQTIDLDDTPALVVVVRDITQLKETQQLLQVSEEKFASAFHASPDGLLITRISDGLLLEANDGFSRITGYSQPEVAERSTLELGLWANPADRQHMIQLIGDQGSLHHFTTAIRTKNGQVRICELSAQPIPIGGEPCLLTIARDVTERQQMQEKLLQAATVFESTAEGVMITDTGQRITAVNRAFSEITGYSESEALGQSPRLLASGQHDSAFYAAMWHQLEREGHWQGEIWNRRKNGEPYPEWLTISAVRDRYRQVTHYVGVFADISPLKHAQARLDYQAHHDPLTGLPNRLLFESRLQLALADAANDNHHGAVLFIDLDRFKHINDSLGHPVGDLLLKGIAARLREQLRDVDTVARLGGDEFIILLPGLHSANDAQSVATKLLTCFEAPVPAGPHEFFMSASIGISLFPEHGLDVATLVKNADAAMYRAKARGRNRIEFYTHDLASQATERMALETELRRALERNELSLSYQPKFSLQYQTLVGAEALVRWNHPQFGEIPPERFIPLAEESGLILPLGDWVLEHACRQMQHWQERHVPFGPLSINLAGAQLRQPQLVERLQRLIQTLGLEAQRLQLEITESFIMSQAEEALSVLHNLKALGVQLAIDDFGTGYSSLSYLKRLPLDVLKIDKSFVRGLPDDPNDAAISRAIIALGRSMQLTVIAEGVETKAQEHFLAAEGCEQIQGFIVSAALPAEAFARKFLNPLPAIGAQQKAPV
ncbi:EAL domain-containing protein [Pseudomonas resinovorans]|uniref:bifunctional diguanylate cyclase/phosphodiesterase n=1 Tax=Metapseudomonas resinovorans TaxID=53412 RepID=UPI00237FA940|nr:EAL domain-containing protein [Pseudomonas resinovorans]MDE3736399.1 EAL domain-containing protein [Pseudomonas resinovorans]